MSSWNRRDLLAGAGTALMTAAASTTPAEVLAQAPAGDPPFQLGTVTYNVPKDWDLPTLLRILPAAGVKAVEFRTTHAH